MVDFYVANKEFDKALEYNNKYHQVIDSIANNTDTPTFANTIEKMDFSGQLLKKVSAAFFNVQAGYS